MNITDILSFIKITIEKTAIAAVKSLKSHTYTVKMADPVRVTFKDSPKEVKVNNLTPVTKGLDDVRKAITQIKIPSGNTLPLMPSFPKSMEVSNLPETEKLKGDDPKKYVPVRLTDGDEFYKAEGGGGGVGAVGGRYAYMKSDGTKGQGLMDDHHRPVVFNDEYHLNDRLTINDKKYLGFEDQFANWYIMTIEGTGQDPEDQKFRFATHKNNETINTYAGAWNNKTTLSYGRYSAAF